MKMATKEVLWEMGLQGSQACFWKAAGQQDDQGTFEQLKGGHSNLSLQHFCQTRLHASPFATAGAFPSNFILVSMNASRFKAPFIARTI